MVKPQLQRYLRRRVLTWASAALIGCVSIGAAAAPQQGDDQPSIVAGKGIAEVQTDKGTVQGFVRYGVQTFRGIPYASAGHFLPPEAPSAWEGVRPALSYGYVCPQPDPQMREPQAFFSGWRFWPKSEDCLNLNVWSPPLGATEKKPVMVWLHGGGFFSGSSMELPVYDDTNLARNGDVVVVSVNHRLNVLGYLDLSAHGEQYQSSGNVGMIDIVAALAWVQKNIARFGGDPNNVTIFGQAGGGAKVSTLPRGALGGGAVPQGDRTERRARRHDPAGRRYRSGPAGSRIDFSVRRNRQR